MKILDMRKYFSLLGVLFTLFLLSHSTSVKAVCTGGNNAGALNPQANWQIIGASTYSYYTFVAGYQSEVFIFSFCQGGGNNLVDTQLEIHDNGGNPTGFYNNDHCGFGSEIVFSAPAAGIYRVSIYRFDCATTVAPAGNLAYKRLPTPTTADCLGALPLCNVVNSHPVSSTGTGNYYDLFNFSAQLGMAASANNCPNCLITGELNSMWYTFTVTSGGQLAFTINPNASADYDWSLHNLSNATCANLVNYTSYPPVSCNFAAGSGATGMASSGSGSCQYGGSSVQFNAPITVSAGQTYVLHITNFSGNLAGYSINFSGSTASIVDNTPPTLQEIIYDPYCGSSSLTVQLSEAIWCTGVSPAGFQLTGPMGSYAIADIYSALCVAGENSTYSGTFYDDVWTLELSDFLTQSGTYTLTLNAGGVDDICENPSIQSSLVFEIIGISANVDIISLAGCPGDNQGHLIANSFAGGTPPYSVQWHGPGGFYSENAEISGLHPGVYQLRVTDSEGICEYLEEIDLESAPPIVLSFTGDTVYCEGQNITFNVSSNIDPNASYSWSGPNGWTSSSQNVSIPNAQPSMAGEYSLVVTDTYGCTNALIGTIHVIPNIPVSASNDGPYCTGDQINLTVTDVPGATYAWTGPNGFVANQQNTSIINAQTMHSGNYAVVVSYGMCTSSSNTNVLVTPAVQVSITGINPLCHQQSTGTLTATATNGTPPLNYLWSTGAMGTVLSGVPGAVEYCVTVIDSYGCSATTCHTLTDPTELTVSTATVETECGFMDGQITATATGGAGGYVYMWQTGNLGPQVNNLPPGEICVTVTDANACVVEACDIIPFFGEGIVQISQVQTISCFGQTNAVLSATMSNGMPPFTYQWSVAGQNNSTLAGIGAGQYSVTIYDFYGCPGEDQFTVTQPTQIEIEMTSSDVLCYGGNEGIATVQASGGVPPYQYMWDGGFIGTTYANLTAGAYGVTVSDDNSCSISNFAVINQPENPVGFELVTNNVTCYNRFDGYAIALGSGGTPPYAVFWYQFGQLLATGEEVNTLAAGSYQVRVTDSHNCHASSQFTITEPTELIVRSIVESVSCKGYDDGMIYLTIEGGNYPYELLWNTGDTTITLGNISGGQYYVTITDANYCQRNVGIYVPESSQLCLNIPDAFTPNGDGINDRWEIGYIENYPDAIINVFNRWGQHIYQGRSTSEFWDGTWDGKRVPAGSYIYVVDLRNDMQPFTGVVTVIY